jgi:hypothetical protein
MLQQRILMYISTHLVTNGRCAHHSRRPALRPEPAGRVPAAVFGSSVCHRRPRAGPKPAVASRRQRRRQWHRRLRLKELIAAAERTGAYCVGVAVRSTCSAVSIAPGSAYDAPKARAASATDAVGGRAASASCISCLVAASMGGAGLTPVQRIRDERAVVVLFLYPINLFIKSTKSSLSFCPVTSALLPKD